MGLVLILYDYITLQLVVLSRDVLFLLNKLVRDQLVPVYITVLIYKSGSLNGGLF